jgi:hypothetical protein
LCRNYSATTRSVAFLGRKLGDGNETIYGGELGLSKELLKELNEARII